MKQLERAIILLIDEPDVQLLTSEVIGRPVISYQLRQLVQAGFNWLAIVLPLAADALREILWRSRLELPVHLEVFNIDPKYGLYQALASNRTLWRQTATLAWAKDPTLSFVAPQLVDYQADLVAVTAPDDSEGDGSAWLDHRFLTGFSPIKRREWVPLTGVYRLGRDFWETLRAEPLDRNGWFDALHNYAARHAVKALPLSSSVPAKEQTAYGWGRRVLAEQTANIAPDARIAPTARLSGQVTVARGVRVGEFCVIKGPTYLGERVKIGDFVRLEHVLVERNSIVEAHASLVDQQLPPGSHCQVSWRQRIMPIKTNN